jgi:hypothetical protein
MQSSNCTSLSASSTHGGTPWVVVAHDMAQHLRQTDMTIDSSPWRFLFQIKGIRGVPAGINQIAVAWKTKFSQAQTRVTVGCQGVPFKGGCLTVDTSFAVDPLVNEGEVTRDKMLIFSVKGFCGDEQNDEAAVRLGSLSFRCLHDMSGTPVGQPSRLFKLAIDSSGPQHGFAIVVSMSVTCFPLWMAPAFTSEFDGLVSEADGFCQAKLKETLAKLTDLSQEYVAARSLLSSGCSNGSIALLDPIFRSSVNLAARELLFPVPPFPKCIVDPSFSAVIAPALLQESIAVTIWKYHNLTRVIHSKSVQKLILNASSIIHRTADDAAFVFSKFAFKAWATFCKENKRLCYCACIFHERSYR